MQVLLIALTKEVPRLVYQLVSRSCLPTSATAAFTRANGKNALETESQERGHHLLETLQLLDREDESRVLIRLMNEEHALAALYIEAVKTVRSHLVKRWMPHQDKIVLSLPILKR